MIRVNLAGLWTPGRLWAEWAPSGQRIIAAAAEEIDRVWAEAVATAAAKAAGQASGQAPADAVAKAAAKTAAGASTHPGRMLFDGAMCRLESFRVDGDTLRLSVSPTSYKSFLATNLAGPGRVERFGPAVAANPVGVSALLTTADGWLLLGRRSAAVAHHPHRVHPFAGTLEPGDVPDVFGAVRRELREELGLDGAAIGSLACLGMVRDGAIDQPELIFAVDSTLGRAEIERGLDGAEHDGLVAIPAMREGIERALADAGDWTPVARGAVGLVVIHKSAATGDSSLVAGPPRSRPGGPPGEDGFGGCENPR